MEGSASFGYWVRRRRQALDLTQAALAHAVGCAPVTIKKIEGDERRPSCQMAERLAACLQIPAGEREKFMASARGERSTMRLPLPTAPLDRPGQPAAPPDLAGLPEAPVATVFVRRRHELAQLEAQLARAVKGDGRVVFVTGEAGQGKTALLREFARRAQALHGDLLVAAGTCNAFTAMGDPFLPFRDVLGMLTGDVAPHVADGTITREHARCILQSLPDTVGILLDEGPELLENFVSSAAILGRVTLPSGDATRRARIEAQLESPDRPSVATPVAGGAAERPIRSADTASPYRQRPPLVEQYTRVVQRIAARTPLLLLLDDLQWADAASLNLLFHLARHLPGTPMLIVGAYRPSDLQVGHAAGGFETTGVHPLPPLVDELTRTFGNLELDLDRINAGEGRRFVDAILDREPNGLDDRFRARLFGHTLGHPLFTLELLDELRERGDLLRDGTGRWLEGPRLDWNVLPARVEAVIRQRVARLDEELRELLAAGSVEGETFSAEIVAAVLGLDEQRVLRRLSRELEGRHRMVHEREEVQVGGRHLSRYQFSHVLFQRYLYGELGRSERRGLHGAIASTLEELYQRRTDEIAAQLARHYREAGRSDKAIDYLLRAGDQARTLYAHQEAGDCYRWALSLLQRQGDSERAARTLVKLGLTYQSAFDFEHARQAYDEGFALWQQAGGLRPVKPGFAAPHALRIDWRDPPTLDPTRAGNFWSAGVIGQLFSGLVELTPESDVVPDVARRWEVGNGGRTYIFRLREDVHWSDGTPVTAADFEFAWRRALSSDRSSLASLLLADVKGAVAFQAGAPGAGERLGIHALDPTTLAVELEEPVAYLPNLLAHPATYPVPGHIVAAHGEAWTRPGTIVTNGPFTLRAWQPRELMVFERNPAYGGRFTGNLEQVALHLTADPFRKLALYEANELDVFRAWFLPAAVLDRVRQQRADDYRSGPQVTTLYVGFDVSREPFADARVRRALTMAFDRDRHAAVVHRGHVSPAAGGFVPPGMPGHSPGIGLPYDPAQARRLLADAGYPHGEGFPCTALLVSEFRAQEARSLVESWREQLRIDVEVKVIEEAISSEVLRATRPRMFFNGWAADYADPDSFLRVCLDATLPGWHDPDFERLVAMARRVSDQPRRMELYKEADRILVEQAALIPLTYSRVQLLVKPWVERYPISAMKGWFWKDVVLGAHE